MTNTKLTISQIEQELEARYQRKLATMEAKFESELETMSSTIVAEVDELKERLQKSYDKLTERLESERDYLRMMHETLLKAGIIKYRYDVDKDKRAQTVIEDVDTVVRYYQMGVDFEKMLAPIKENEAVKTAWDRFIVTLRMTGYDGT